MKEVAVGLKLHMVHQSFWHQDPPTWLGTMRQPIISTPVGTRRQDLSDPPSESGASMSNAVWSLLSHMLATATHASFKDE
jgi:hypothetical protein